MGRVLRTCVRLLDFCKTLLDHAMLERAMSDSVRLACTPYTSTVYLTYLYVEGLRRPYHVTKPPNAHSRDLLASPGSLLRTAFPSTTTPSSKPASIPRWSTGVNASSPEKRLCLNQSQLLRNDTTSSTSFRGRGEGKGGREGRGEEKATR